MASQNMRAEDAMDEDAFYSFDSNIQPSEACAQCSLVHVGIASKAPRAEELSFLGQYSSTEESTASMDHIHHQHWLDIHDRLTR